MLSKQAIIVALVGLNLLLLAGVVLVGYTPPAAMAQEAAAAAGEPADTVLGVQAEIGNDAIYVIDGRNQFLHVFRTPFPYRDGDPVQIFYIGTRDLSREFRKEARK